MKIIAKNKKISWRNVVQKRFCASLLLLNITMLVQPYQRFDNFYDTASTMPWMQMPPMLFKPTIAPFITPAYDFAKSCLTDVRFAYCIASVAALATLFFKLQSDKLKSEKEIVIQQNRNFCETIENQSKKIVSRDAEIKDLEEENETLVNQYANLTIATKDFGKYLLIYLNRNKLNPHNQKSLKRSNSLTLYDRKKHLNNFNTNPIIGGTNFIDGKFTGPTPLLQGSPTIAGTGRNNQPNILPIDN